MGGASSKGERIAAEYRARMKAELEDIRRRSEERGKLREMDALMERIRMACTDSVITELADRHKMTTDEIMQMLIDNPVRT